MAALAHSGRDGPQRQFRGAQAQVHDFDTILTCVLSRVPFLLAFALAVVASWPAVASTDQPSAAADSTVTDLSTEERPDLTHSHLALHARSAQIDFAPHSRSNSAR
jgi:hypothetical protein